MNDILNDSTNAFTIDNFPESVKFKLPSKAERLINTAFSPKILMFEFAPNGCRKTYIIKCLKHLISCEVQALFINRVSRIQVTPN